MATSRRRERELARRRFERRRQREMERRAKAKQRSTWIGAAIGTAAVLAVGVYLIFFAFGGSSKKPTAAVSPAAAVSSTAAPTPTPTTAAVKAPTKCAKISPDPTAKGQPSVPQVTGKLSNKLVVRDVKKGHGPAAKSGATLSVDYIGVSCDTGKVFDATYKDGGKPFSVTPLGKASVITGWNKGLIGVKAGGIRELVIPASEAYGSTGSGAIAPNDTLVFLVSVKSVKA